MSATRDTIYHHRPHASFTDKDNQDCRHSEQPELCMHSDDHLYSWLPDTIGLVFFHLGSPICMRIVSNFAISRRMVPLAWERKWMWHFDIVSVERSEMVVRRLALTNYSRRSTNWKRQRLPASRHHTFRLQQGCWGPFSSSNMQSVLVYRIDSPIWSSVHSF